MQYFKPTEDHLFVGDCMPFFHDGVFHLYYLLDEGHHSSKGGLGAHQWAHASTTDLVGWRYHPLAIPITAEWEGSICTGSVLWHDGLYYGYYATRMPDRSQHLGLATSEDGIHFAKTLPNPLASPGEEYTTSYRDPCVFRDEAAGLFHMLITSALREYPPAGKGGCLAHLVSPDLRDWRAADPFIIPGYPGDPECPDYFAWHGWYYLVFSNEGITRYRMSRQPLGPWTRPPCDRFDGPMARVMKTAAFTGDRRIGVAFLPTLQDDRDDGAWLYAGNAVFREIIQHDDGTLGTRFPPEMTPATAEPLALDIARVSGEVSGDGRALTVSARDCFGAAMMQDVPTQARITLDVIPEPSSARFGLCLRAQADLQQGYELRFSPGEQRAEIRGPQWGELVDNAGRSIHGLEGLDRPFSLEIVQTGDIIDVCIDGRRTLVTRCPQVAGDRLFFWCHNARVAFNNIRIAPLAM